MKKHHRLIRGFTLAEALTTLVVLGFIAILTTPVLRNATGKSLYRAGISRALTETNAVIAKNIANAKGSAFKTSNLCDYISSGLTTKKTCENSTRFSGMYLTETNDGIQFFFPKSDSDPNGFFADINLRTRNAWGEDSENLTVVKTGNCGSFNTGARANAIVQSTMPCVMMVDVNGETKPNRLSTDEEIFDQFIMIITERDAFPYGAAAQKAYYGEK